MSDYVISCCSTADLTPAALDARDIKYIYFNYELDGVPYKDDLWQSRTPHDLYDSMLAGASARTSQVGVGEYVEYFTKFLEKGLDVLHVTLSTGISGTYNSAITARDLVLENFPERTVTIVDSLAASSGYGLLMDKAADLRDEGMGIGELAAWIEQHRLNLQHWFFSTDLTFFIKGGRISKTAGLMGSLLRICPVMDVAPDGSLRVVEKIRTKKKAMQRTLQKMQELAKGGAGYAGKIYMCQSVCEDDARQMADLIEEAFPNMSGRVETFPIGAVIGAHTGPGTIAVFFWGAERL